MYAPASLHTSSSVAPSAHVTVLPSTVIVATGNPLLRLRDGLSPVVPEGRLLAVRVGPVVRFQVVPRKNGERVLVPVHVVEHVHRIVEPAADLNSLVGAGLGAQAAVHADAEVNLV